jgi:hypothetical protein
LSQHNIQGVYVIDTSTLPSRVGTLSQPGVDVGTAWVRNNPTLARAAAALMLQNPRAAIERFFHLTPNQG